MQAVESQPLRPKLFRDAVPDHRNALDDTLEAFGFGRFQLRLFILCGFGHFVDACEIAMLPLLLPVLKEYWHLTNTDLAFIAASTPTGMIIGAPLLGALSDRIGRRPVFLYSLFFSSLFGLFSAFSPNLLWFIALRAALGVGYGGNIVVDVSLFCEFLPVANRGVYMALLHVFFGLGVMFIVTLTWTIIPYLGWRWLVAMSVVPAFVMLLFRKGVPESPRFLLLSGREAEAKKVLRQIAEINGAEEHVLQELSMLHLAPATSGDKIGHMRALRILLMASPLALTVVPLAACWFFNSFAGSVFHWLPLYIAERQGQVMDHAYRSAFMMGLGDVVGSLLMCFLIEWTSRLLLLRVLLFGMAVAVYMLGFVSDVTLIPMIIPFVIAGKSCIMSMLYTYTPEVLPTQLRTTGFGVCSALHRLAPIVAPFPMAHLLELSFTYVCLVFGSLYALAGVAAILLPVETANRAINDKVHLE